MAESLQNRRRWNSFKDRLVERFGGVVYKVGVDAGFDCPNRDGSKAWGGCAYCSQLGSLAPNQDPKRAIADQLRNGMAFVKRRYGAEKYIAYYQAFTNTYATVPVIRERLDASLIDPDIVGMSVATRPDCIDQEKVELLAEYAAKLPYFTVEFGLQSVYQNRLEWVNRQETTDDYIRAMELLNRAKIPVISHVIFGFPGESQAEMLDTVRLARDMKSTGIKLQMLHVIKGTTLAVMYGREPFELLSMQDYGETVIRAIEMLPPEMEIHRITGETERSQLVAPEWVGQKAKFFVWFEAELEKRNTWQGKAIGAEAPMALKEHTL